MIVPGGDEVVGKKAVANLRGGSKSKGRLPRNKSEVAEQFQSTLDPNGKKKPIAKKLKKKTPPKAKVEDIGKMSEEAEKKEQTKLKKAKFKKDVPKSPPPIADELGEDEPEKPVDTPKADTHILKKAIERMKIVPMETPKANEIIVKKAIEKVLPKPKVVAPPPPPKSVPGPPIPPRVPKKVKLPAPVPQPIAPIPKPVEVEGPPIPPARIPLGPAPPEKLTPEEEAGMSVTDVAKENMNRKKALEKWS